MASVLIADNDRAVNGLLSEVLARFGVPVRQVFDGRAAVDAARDPEVAVLVCDLDMPGATGFEVLESLRDLALPPRTIVVSGYLDAAARERLLAMPFVREVFGKPFDLLAFAERVRALLATAGDGDGGGAEVGAG